MEPGAIEKIMTEIMEGLKINSGRIIFFSLFWLIPMAMAFLSVTLQDMINRKINIILGIIFTIFYIGHLFMHLMRWELPLDHLIMCLLMILLPVLILWYALKWPIVQKYENYLMQLKCSWLLPLFYLVFFLCISFSECIKEANLI